jgi:pantetheine-phosphate adenylyltransferase
MRVISGQWRGRRLLGPPRGAETRPTSDKVREAVFNVLNQHIANARVLDLFAGTGALGMEALSRGARHVTFVESDRGLCETIQTNLENFEVSQEYFTLLKRDVRRSVKHVTGPFDLVFIDPPYGHLLEREALASLCESGLLSPKAVVVVEHASREVVTLPATVMAIFEEPDTRHYGDTSVTLFTVRASEENHSVHETTPSQGRLAVYAGSFDPPTQGHLDIIRRTATLFDRTLVAVAHNQKKQTLFTVEERVALLREVTQGIPGVEIDVAEGLLVEYAHRRGAIALIRGLRATADFDFEFQMSCMNHHLVPGVETVFLMTAPENQFVSSSLVKEVAALGGDVTRFVPPTVLPQLLARLAMRENR